MFRLSAFLSLLLFCGIVHADIVSLDSNYVAGQANVVGKLNSDRTKLVNGVNNIQGVYSGTPQTSGQIKAATIGNENMYADASPRVYLDELFIENLDDNNGIIANGLEFQTSANLSASTTPGVGYTRGYRIEKTSGVSKVFSASKWTYAFLCQNGSLDYLERNIGVSITTSEYPTNCQPLSRVSTDTTTVNSVLDLRKLKFTLESYDSVYDESTESSLKNLLVGQGNPYKVGAMLQYSDASSFSVTAGAAMINGQARDRIAYTSDPSWPVASTSAQDGLDVGTRSNGTYYVYLVADAEDQRGYTVVHSLNDTAPSGKTSYVRIGQFYTNVGTISRDSVVNYINGANVLPATSQLVKGWITFNGTAGTLLDSYNVSGFAKNATGDYTITWDADFLNTDYAVTCMSTGDQQLPVYATTTDKLAGSVRLFHTPGDSAVNNDTAMISCIAVGDR